MSEDLFKSRINEAKGKVMGKQRIAILGIGVVCSTFVLNVFSADPRPGASSGVMEDAMEDAQTPRQPPVSRPEQKLSPHDQSPIFSASKA